MDGFNIVPLATLIKVIGENETKSFLSNFSCPLNKDVEYFLKCKAIEFSRQDLAKTFVVMTSYKGEQVICGYFALATKIFQIPKKNISKTIARKVAKYGKYVDEIGCYQISAPLIGQLGKNYQEDYNKLISGDELLNMALDKVIEAQKILGGKVVYLECEDDRHLTSFYKKHGFFEFNKRELDVDEVEVKGSYLLQLLRYNRQ